MDDDGNKARILLIEDDAGQARLLQKALERSGYVVHSAFNSDEGLMLLESNSFDVVLADYSLPGCSGIDLLRILAERFPRIPVIMVTGNGNEKVAVDALKAGACDYIVKDTDMEYLQLLPIVIEQVLQQERLFEERERMRAEVRESEERYRKLVELCPDGIVICAGGSFAFLNPAAAEMLGAKEERELLGRPVLDFIHPDFREITQERLAAAFGRKGDGVPFAEEKFVRLDGREIDVEVSALPFVYQGEAAIQMIFRDITEHNLARRRLEYLAKFDPLTSLPNRALFFDRLNKLLDHGRRYPHKLALLFLDLDHYKEVNDSLGHDVGDQLLQQAAVRLTGCLREADSVARMGGDEFAVILSRINEVPDAEVVARKIIAALGDPFVLGSNVCTIGVSIGISVFPRDADDADTLLRKADAAMYCAKESGRNTFRFCTEIAA